MSNDSALFIHHEPERQRFVCRVDGLESVADYRRRGAQIDFSHTYVPDALRGRGIAEKLVREALAWARDQGLHIEASCWYVRKFLR